MFLNSVSGAGLLWVPLFFLVLLGLLVRRDAGWVLVGFLRALLVYLALPFRTLLANAREIAQLGRQGNPGADEKDHSFLHTVLLYLRIGMVISTLGLVSMGIYMAGVSFLPSSSSVDYRNASRSKLSDAEKQVAEAQARRDAFQAQMGSRKSDQVAQFRKSKGEAIVKEDAAVLESEKAIAANPEAAAVLQNIRTYLQSQDASGAGYSIAYAFQQIDAHIEKQGALPAESRQRLAAWSQATKNRKELQKELDGFREEDLVRSMNQELERMNAQLESAQQEQRHASARLAGAEEMAAFRPGSALVVLFTFLAQAFGLAWGLGFLLEVLTRMLGLSDHVREIRDATVQPVPDPAP